LAGIGSVYRFILERYHARRGHEGIEKKRMTSPPNAARLDVWLTTLVLRYRSRILPFGEQSADQWGRVMALHPTVPVEDSQLVATALQHNLTFATRNVRHIAQTGVAFVDPF
jgi:predicted nucleic acid-binding protein